MGVDSVKLSGFAAGDTLRLIREVVDRGVRGRVASRYYYAGTQLRYYESEGDVVHVGADKSMTKRKVRLVLAFNEQSAAVEATHTIDGQSAPLDTALTGAVTARATELARQWAMERTTTPR